jgi:hypothetical protein
VKRVELNLAKRGEMDMEEREERKVTLIRATRSITIK